ncbi:SCP-like protein [Necator americanus]|uniref:SCP-like protein n=1 Tax=Necator americanus TaxID=51031 RepID=W2SJ68_NECAM|nr:SCP-like protein [Necator americanus]ETN68916.1 SCP-like protein [Necator americanus]
MDRLQRCLILQSYNCELEGLALALTRACIPPGEMSKVIAGKSINYEIIRKHSGTPSDDDAVEDIKQLMEKWKDSRYNVNFNKSTVIYGDENAAPFARIVYKRSISLGCAVTYCPPKRTAYTCAYSESPVIGEPLYSPSKKSTGCTSNSQCRKAIPGSSTFCNTHLNLCTTSLLALNDSTSTVATTEPQTTVESTAAKTSSAASQSTATAENSQSTAAATTSQTTTAATTSQTTAAATTSQTTAAATTSQTTAAATTSQTTAAATTSQTTAAASVTTPADSSGVMTDAIRQLVVDKHNTDRSLLAQGAIRNGKPGKPNLGPATNMLRMRYDIALEAKAQAYANTCALTKSAVSTRPDSGENTNVIQSTTIAISDALTRSMQTWWNQISINGLNAKLLYTSTLDTRSNAPLEFTQEPANFDKSAQGMDVTPRKLCKWHGLLLTRLDVELAVVLLLRSSCAATTHVETLSGSTSTWLAPIA